MHAFMRSQLVQPGGFADRRGQPDLYYTMFGLLFAAATEMPIDLNATERYLQSFAPQSLDLVHLASLTRSHLLLKYLRRPHLATWPRQTLPPTLRNAYNALDTGELERFPHRDPRSPYSQMLRWSLAEDLGLNYIHQNLDQYRQPDGMFANLPGDDAPAVNATAAALVLLNANGADRRTLQPDLRGSLTCRPQALPAMPPPQLLTCSQPPPPAGADLLPTPPALFS